MSKNSEKLSKNKVGRPESKVKKKAFNLSITATKIPKIKKKAIDEGMNSGELVENALGTVYGI